MLCLFSHGFIHPIHHRTLICVMISVHLCRLDVISSFWVYQWADALLWEPLFYGYERSISCLSLASTISIFTSTLLTILSFFFPWPACEQFRIWFARLLVCSRRIPMGKDTIPITLPYIQIYIFYPNMSWVQPTICFRLGSFFLSAAFFLPMVYFFQRNGMNWENWKPRSIEMISIDLGKPMTES